MNWVILGDCLKIMNFIKNKSVHMILCDLPYEKTANDWDKMLNLSLLWNHYERIIKDNGAIVLFGQGIFTAKLIMSNEKLFRYDLVWDKVRAVGFFNANKMPMRKHENILVFYKKLPIYNPQKTDKNIDFIRVNRVKNNLKQGGYVDSDNYFGKKPKFSNKYEENKSMPVSILPPFKKHRTKENLHPNQKPVLLLEYLIKTYTNEDMLVLDNTAGVLSTAVACENLQRKFICIEKEIKYVKLGLARLNKSYKLKKYED